MQPTDPEDNPTEPLDALEPSPGDTVDSAEPAPGGRRRGATVLGVAAAVLALVAAGAFGAVLASDGSDRIEGVAASGDTGDDTNDDDSAKPLRDRLEKWAGRGHGPFGRPHPGALGFGHLMGRGLHGSAVVEDPDGGYQTMLAQQGEATEVSDTSITVRSEDGFQATYRLTDDTTVVAGPDGTGSIEQGDDVAVTAVQESGRARALHVFDLSQLTERLDLRSPDGQPEDVPSPTATSGASA